MWEDTFMKKQKAALSCTAVILSVIISACTVSGCRSRFESFSGTSPNAEISAAADPAPFRVALDAGHYLGTEDRRCMVEYDPDQTQEWVLNDRLARAIEALLSGYKGVEVLRTDDTTGKTWIELEDRRQKAIDWGANLILSIHYNAGIEGGSGGGITLFRSPYASASSRIWQYQLYSDMLKNGGLRGDREVPLETGDFQLLKELSIPSVLCEAGFMDSSADTPVIITSEYTQDCARGIVNAIRTLTGILPDGTRGDCTGNGRVSVTDALICLKACRGAVLSGSAEIQADFDGSGTITADDAAAIFDLAMGEFNR